MRLIVRRRPWRFLSWLSGLDSLKLVSRCPGTLVRTNSDHPLLYKELRGCLLSVRRLRRRRKGLCLAWLQCLVKSGLVHPHLYCWTLVMVIQMNQLRMRLPLNFVFCCRLMCDVNVSYVRTRMSSFLVTIAGVEPGAYQSLRLWENLSGLRSTVAGPPTT
jgi:hypothetical protein